jgi:ribosomal protein L7/L12
MPGSGEKRFWWPQPVHIPKKTAQEADRRAGEALVALLDQAGKAEIETLIAHGKPIYAMRRVRELTGVRLLDAKRMVNSLQR